MRGSYCLGIKGRFQKIGIDRHRGQTNPTKTLMIRGWKVEAAVMGHWWYLMIRKFHNLITDMTYSGDQQKSIPQLRHTKNTHKCHHWQTGKCNEPKTAISRRMCASQPAQLTSSLAILVPFHAFLLSIHPYKIHENPRSQIQDGLFGLSTTTKATPRATGVLHTAHHGFFSSRDASFLPKDLFGAFRPFLPLLGEVTIRNTGIYIIYSKILQHTKWFNVYLCMYAWVDLQASGRLNTCIQLSEKQLYLQ